MAFTITKLEKQTVGGMIYEKQTFVATSTTTGTVTCDTTIQPEISEPLTYVATRLVATTVPTHTLSGGVVTLAGMTSGDTGYITFIGFAR